MRPACYAGRQRCGDRAQRVLSSAGFSLVEVCLAVAVIAVGLLAVIGLFPQGLHAARNAADNTLSAMIVQDLMDDIRLNSTNTNFKICSYCLPPHAYLGDPLTTNDIIWFDAQGDIVPPYDTNGYFRVEIIYQPDPSDIPSLYKVAATMVWPALSTAPQNTNVFVTKIASYH